MYVHVAGIRIQYVEGNRVMNAHYPLIEKMLCERFLCHELGSSSFYTYIYIMTLLLITSWIDSVIISNLNIVSLQNPLKTKKTIGQSEYKNVNESKQNKFVFKIIVGAKSIFITIQITIGAWCWNK